jgi:hypothetical protein
MKDIYELPRLIADLYNIVDELSKMFPELKFTPDGHLVGSIGEAVAKEIYGLKLQRASTKGYDGTLDEKKVQVKMTGGNRIQFSASDEYPELLIVMHLDRDIGFTEIYAGEFPAEFITGHTKNQHAYYQCTLNRLKEKDIHRIPQVIKLSLLNAKFFERKNE